MENQFELLHVGLNSGSPEKAEETAKLFSLMFNLPVKMGNSSVFAGKYFECMGEPRRLRRSGRQIGDPLYNQVSSTSVVK